MIGSRKNTRRLWISVLVLGSVFVMGNAIQMIPSRGVDVPMPAALEPTVEQVRSPFDTAFAEGIAHFRTGDAHGAAKAFERARQLQPHAPEVYANLGFAYLELKTMQAAKAAFSRALDIRSDQVNAYYGLAEALDALGDRQAAIGAMQTYVHLSGEADPFRRRALAAMWEWGVLESAPAAQPATAQREIDPPVVTPPVSAGRSLGAVSFIGFDGKRVPYSSYAGKVVVLNVWATWCPPCRREMPSLQRLADVLDPEIFAVVGLSVDKDGDFAREFLNDLEIGFTNYWDSGEVIAEGRLGLTAYPHTLIIGTDGTVVSEISGQRDWDSTPMIAMIEAIADTGATVTAAETVK